MKNVKLLAAALMFATVGAYAGTDDGNVQGNLAPQVSASQQAPAPVPSAAETEVRAQDSGVVSPNP